MFEIDWLPGLTYPNFNWESLTTYTRVVTKNAKIASRNMIDSLSCEISEAIAFRQVSSSLFFIQLLILISDEGIQGP